jgi:hypothetical protein
MAARRLVEWRDAHQPMDSGFRGHQAEGVLAGQQYRRALDARFVPGLIVDDLALEATPLRPAQVHAQQHLGPVLRLGAAGAGMDRDDRVGEIVFAGEHLLALGGVDFLLELVEPALEVAGDLLARARPFEQDPQVVVAPLEGLQQRQVGLDAAAALHDFLRLGLVAPEVRSAYVFFDVGEQLLETCCLKDTSGVPPSDDSGRRTAVRNRRE